MIGYHFKGIKAYSQRKEYIAVRNISYFKECQHSHIGYQGQQKPFAPFFISPFTVDKGGIDIHLHILPYKEIQRRTGQQKEHKPGFSAGIHQDTSYKEYYLPIFNGCQIKNNQKNRQEPKQEFQTAENKAILTNYVS